MLILVEAILMPTRKLLLEGFMLIDFKNKCVKTTHVLFRSLSLKWAFLSLVIIPFGVISALTIYFSFRITEKELEKQMEQQIELVARALHDPILLSLQKNEKERIRMMFSSTEDIRRIYTIDLFDKKGELIWSSNLNKKSFDPVLTENVIASASSENTYNQVGDRSVYSHFEPIIAQNGHVLGLVHLTREESDIKNESSKTRIKIIIIYSIAWSAIGALFIYIYKGFILTPIRQLANQLYDFNLDDSEKQNLIELDGAAEFKIIKEAFNSMYKKLSTYKVQVRDEQEKKIKLQDKLKQSEKLAAIGTLAGGVAHDLGNPISSIDATVQRMERIYKDDQGHTRYLNYIRNETKRMENIIHQLLNFSEQKTFNREPIVLQQIVQDLVSSFKEVNTEIDIKLSIQGVEKPIPLDRFKIEQLISNLIKNSIEAVVGTNEKSPVIQVSVISSSEEAKIIVEDSGAGIDSKKLSKVFEPFYSDGKYKNKRNKGLGLAISHGIVQAHGGEISISKSSMLGGAMFTVTLPNLTDQEG